MFDGNYKPKYFKSVINEIKRVGNKTIFKFENELAVLKEIEVDESIERIKSRMEDVKNGIRKKVYLSNGMMNVDLDLLDTGNWNLFDEFDVYEFEM